MESRYPCPVCLGTRMKKTSLTPKKTLVVDLCPRCGGAWFDRGEMQRLRRVEIAEVKPHIDLSRGPNLMRCHFCHVLMIRNEVKCPMCRWQNIIECPVCCEPMERSSHRDLILDVCNRCGGLWFDRNELAAIWNPAIWDDTRVWSGTGDPVAYPAWSLLDGLFYLPDGGGIGSGAAAQASFAAADGAGGAVVEAGSTVLEGVAEGAGELLLHAAIEAGPSLIDGAVGVAGEAIGAVAEGAAEVAVEAVAEVAVEAVAEAAGAVGEAILEFIVELIGGALG